MNIRLAALGALVPACLAHAQLGGCTSLTQVAAVNPGGNQSHVVTDNGYILLMDNGNKLLRLYRVSNPANPVLRSTISVEEYIDTIALDMLHRVAATCVGDGHERDLDIYDYADPRHPILAHHLIGDSLGGYIACAIDEEILLASTPDHLLVYDVGNPASPVERARLGVPWVTDMVVQDGLLYMTSADPHPSIYIFSIADPALPHLLSIAPTGPLPMRMAVGNNVVYLVSGIRNIYAYDVSDPYHPQFASIVSSPLSIVNVAARFNAVYSVETNTGGLHVYDMVDPYHPRWIDSHNPPYSPWDVDVMQGMLVVADRFDGFEIFQLSDCSRCPPDLAEPTGRLDFFDVQAFLRLFAEQHRATDLDVNAVWDYLDVLLFIEEFSRGCP